MEIMKGKGQYSFGRKKILFDIEIICTRTGHEFVGETIEVDGELSRIADVVGRKEKKRMSFIKTYHDKTLHKVQCELKKRKSKTFTGTWNLFYITWDNEFMPVSGKMKIEF